MQLKKISLWTITFLLCLTSTQAQNLLKYETQIIAISSGVGSNIGGGTFSFISVDKGRFVSQKIVGFGKPATPPISFELTNDFPVNSYYSKNASISIMEATQTITNSLNSMGYSLKATIVTKINPQDQQINAIALIFEKATSYREEELYKLLSELNAKIDTTSKNYIEKAKTEINQNVLNYLKGIPDEVLAKSFKEQLLKNLSIEIDEKLQKMKEEILLELKKQ